MGEHHIFVEFYAFIDDVPDKLPRKIVDFPATFDDQQGICGPRDQAIETKAIGVPQVRLEDFGVSQEAVGLGHGGTIGYPNWDWSVDLWLLGLEFPSSSQ